MNLRDQKLRSYCERWFQPKKTVNKDAADFWEKTYQNELQLKNQNISYQSFLSRKMEKLFSFLREYDPETLTGDILDIGCGTGEFSAAFAKYANHVTAVDISQAARMAAEELVRSQSLSNVDVLPLDFSSFDPDKEGWTKKFDLVFAALAPPCYTLDGIKKMESLSRKYCFLEMGLCIKDEPGNELLKIALDETTLDSKDKTRRFQILYNLLCLDGHFPSLRYYRDEYSSKYQDENIYLERLLRHSTEDAHTEEQKETLKKLLIQQKENGEINSRHKLFSGWILWDVRDVPE